MKSTEISLKEYFSIVNNYTLSEVNFYNDLGVIYYQINIPVDGRSNDNETQECQSHHILISDRYLLKEKFWNTKDKVEFTIDLVELLDYPFDKFQLFKNMYNNEYQFKLTVRKTLRNIGKYPINKKALANLINSSSRIELSNLFIND